MQDVLKTGEPMRRLARITAPHFVAGIELDDSFSVGAAAPIVKYMIGWHWMEVFDYCERKGWGLQRID